MKKFHFALEPAMNWRELKSEQERAKLARLHEEKAVLDGAQMQIHTDLLDASNALNDSAAVDGEHLRQLSAFRSASEIRLKELERRKLECGGRITDQQGRCVQADRDFKLLEKMRSKHRVDWLRGVDREQEEMALESYLSAWTRS
jgi:hypothetical protein